MLAVIPARGGSKGLPGKNLLSVGGRSLLRRAVEAALAAERVDRVVVSSDDDAILAEAAASGAATLRRPADLAGDTASSESALLHALDSAEGSPQIVLLLQCTSPFTTAGDIDRLVGALDDDWVGSAFLAATDHSFLWRVDQDGSARGVNHDAAQPRERRQERGPSYRETGAGYAMRVAAFRESGHRFCGRTTIVTSDAPPIEVDDAGDLALARALAEAEPRSAPPPERLRAIRALITDFDGVHTDDAVLVDQNGTEHVRCSRRDGMGIERLRLSGLPILILSKEVNPVVARRAEKLKLPVVHGANDKLPVLAAWAEEQGLELDAIAYAGNDVNDVPCMQAVGISFAPSDSHPSALAVATYVLSLPGGNGALRELADMILAAREESPA